MAQKYASYRNGAKNFLLQLWFKYCRVEDFNTKLKNADITANGRMTQLSEQFPNCFWLLVFSEISESQKSEIIQKIMDLDDDFEIWLPKIEKECCTLWNSPDEGMQLTYKILLKTV